MRDQRGRRIECCGCGIREAGVLSGVEAGSDVREAEELSALDTGSERQ